MRGCLSLVAILLLGACAAGVSDNPGGGGDDVSSRPDGGREIDAARGTPDARPPIDAPHVTPDAPHAAPDAAVSTPDAGLFCNSTADCGPGDCCFYLGNPPGFCVPGTAIGDVCLPS